MLIHLGQVAGRKNHPEDAAEKHSASEFPRVKLDQFGNIMSVPDESDASDEPGDSDHADTEKGAIPRRRVYRLIAELTADREPRTVHKVRKQLLGVGPHKRPIHDLPIHRDLYEEISGYLHSEKDQFDVTATLESNGLMIEYNGEKGLYTADEARDLAASFVRPANSKERATDRLAGLIRFLRYGADIIEEEQVEQEPYENLDEYLEAMPASRRVSERCHRCGDSTDVWVYEKIEPTIIKKHYACEMCGCEWTEVRQD